MPKKPSKTRQKVHRAFREVHRNEPETVKKTRARHGKAAADKQLKRIALDKARRAGARIPRS